MKPQSLRNNQRGKDDSLRSGGRYPAQARFPGPKTCQGFALKRNHPHGFCYARNLHSKIQSSKKYSRGRGKLSLEGAKPAVGFEDYIGFIYVRRCRAERRKGVFERPAESLLVDRGRFLITSSKL
ncbi:hypothetical protein TNCV_2333991 [Trichonephila clavipes]|nr:hypothetical protein TNCV_2333991 [Trichonephila clavipes]